MLKNNNILYFIYIYTLLIPANDGVVDGTEIGDEVRFVDFFANFLYKTTPTTIATTIAVIQGTTISTSAIINLSVKIDFPDDSFSIVCPVVPIASSIDVLLSLPVSFQ